MEACVWGETADISFLCVSCCPSMLVVHILASLPTFCPSLCCLRPHGIEQSTCSYVLPFWATVWRAHRPLSAAGCCQFLGQPSCSGTANKTALSFSSRLLFCHSAVCGIPLASKKHECGKTSAYRAAVLLNTMPNLFFKHPERLFLLPPWGDNSTSHLLFIAVTLILIFNLNYSFFW